MIEVKERPKSRSGNTAFHIRKIGVIGAGQMGSGIAHVSALAGFDVKLNDLSADRIKAALKRISPAETLDAFADCDLIVEAATEKEDTKRAIFASLCPVLKADAIV